MKKGKGFRRFWSYAAVCAGLTAALCVGVPAIADEPVTAEKQVTAENTVPTTAPVQPETPEVKPTATPKPVKNGWVKYSNGRKRYYKKDKYLTGRRKIDGKYYYFNPKNGYMKTSSWVKIGEKKFYFGKNGVGYTGLKKVNKKWYFFTKYGTLKTKKITVDKVTYYMDDSGNVEAYQKGSKYYYPSGKKMDTTKAANFESLQYAKVIVNQITTPGQSNSQKLLTCFNWVIKHYYRTTHIYTRQANWASLFANDYLKGGMYGNCFSDSCAFAFLAKAIGYQNVYVCVDTTGIREGHCFAQVDGLFYDPLFAEAKNFSTNYAAPLGVYSLYPLYKEAI